MAYCTNCGKQIGQVRFCPHCGAKQQTESPMSSQGTSSQSAPSQSAYSYQTQTPVSDPYRPAAQKAEPQRVAPQASAAQFPLKWHKWMIYFVLWAHVLINVVNGATYCSYIGIADLAILFAAVYFALAVFAGYTRFQLAKFRKGAPKKLLIYLLCSLALSVFEVWMAGAMAESAGSIGIVLAQVLWNWRYYASREELFVN